MLLLRNLCKQPARNTHTAIQNTAATWQQNKKKKILKSSSRELMAIAHWVRYFCMRFSVFSYSSSFPIKMHATDAKTQKIEPDPNFFLTDESFRGSVQTWLTQREVVFIF